MAHHTLTRTGKHMPKKIPPQLKAHQFKKGSPKTQTAAKKGGKTSPKK
jgi:hypothetical protein